MDENRVTGTAKNIGEKVEEGFGRLARTRNRILDSPIKSHLKLACL
jgi:hypothetical protein